ncbi:MAG: hypothetical protein OHK0029_17660 [Armatimonadaceae bacterium]
MARPRKNATTIPAAEAPKDGETPTPRRRRRRRAPGTSDTYSETSTLINAVLRSRRDHGATPEVLQHVISWAHSVREEGEELREMTGRTRRQKPNIPGDRVARYELNRALLDGVLAGTITLRVEDDGKLLFVDTTTLVQEVVVKSEGTAEGNGNGTVSAPESGEGI